MCQAHLQEGTGMGTRRRNPGHAATGSQWAPDLLQLLSDHRPEGERVLPLRLPEVTQCSLMDCLFSDSGIKESTRFYHFLPGLRACFKRVQGEWNLPPEMRTRVPAQLVANPLCGLSGLQDLICRRARQTRLCLDLSQFPSSVTGHFQALLLSEKTRRGAGHMGLLSPPGSWLTLSPVALSHHVSCPQDGM